MRRRPLARSRPRCRAGTGPCWSRKPGPRRCWPMRPPRKPVTVTRTWRTPRARNRPSAPGRARYSSSGPKASSTTSVLRALDLVAVRHSPSPTRYRCPSGPRASPGRPATIAGRGTTGDTTAFRVAVDRRPRRVQGARSTSRRRFPRARSSQTTLSGYFRYREPSSATAQSSPRDQIEEPRVGDGRPIVARASCQTPGSCHCICWSRRRSTRTDLACPWRTRPRSPRACRRRYCKAPR